MRIVIETVYTHPTGTAPGMWHAVARVQNDKAESSLHPHEMGAAVDAVTRLFEALKLAPTAEALAGLGEGASP